MGMAPTGNGRRESYAQLPMPRMTNTYMLAGKSEPGDIIASVEKGLYAVNFGGGQVDITSGSFVFSASEAYLIENGKITRPVKGATLIGKTGRAACRARVCQYASVQMHAVSLKKYKIEADRPIKKHTKNT